jgi:hypothetical protein
MNPPVAPNDEFRPNETQRMRTHLQESRPARETLGTSTGLGAASVVLWLADLAGVKMDPIVAGVIGGVVTSLFSTFLRKRIMKGTETHVTPT